MSFFRKLTSRGSTTPVERKHKPGGGNQGRSPQAKCNRRLRMDPLEQRTLLSLTPVDFQDYLINTAGSNDVTNTARSVASDHDGNFVVVWTHNNLTTTDINARYMTDQTERVTLPQATALKGAGRFTLNISIPDSVGNLAVAQTGSISVDPADPWHTASLIEKAINKSAGVQPFAPVFFYPPPSTTGADPYEVPVPSDGNLIPMTKVSIPIEVSVVPVKTAADPDGLVTFDITFVGESGKRDLTHKVNGVVQTALEVTKVLDATNAVLYEKGVSPIADRPPVNLMKVSSPAFKVNSPEVDDPLGGSTDTNQTNPTVAMDADGEFVIAWENQVDPSVTYGSGQDIFARRFTPMAYTPDSSQVLPIGQFLYDINGAPVAGVRAFGNEFRVNSFTANDQIQPSVAIDAAGNFVVAWANSGQVSSFFNGISAQRFTRDGSRVGNEFYVNQEDTGIHRLPYVGMSPDGWFAITWRANWLNNDIQAVVFNNNGVVQTAFNPTPANPTLQAPGQFVVNGTTNGTATRPTAALDNAHNVFFAWDVNLGLDTITHVAAATDVQAKEYNIAGQVVRTNFRVNSSTYPVPTGTDTPMWSLEQWHNQIVTDADGDFTVTYDGMGPDVTQLDIATDPTWARYMTGEANGILFTQFEADPRFETATQPLYSDSIINATRDGQDAILTVPVDTRAYQNGASSFVLRLYNADVMVSGSLTAALYTDITIPLQFNANGAFDVEATRVALETAIQSAPARIGLSWPGGTNPTDPALPPYGPVRVTSTLVTPVAETQTLSITGTKNTLGGSFTLMGVLNGIAQETVTIPLTEDVVQMQSNLQTALTPLFPGVIVTASPAPPGPGVVTYTYAIQFAGQTGQEIQSLVVGNRSALIGNPNFAIAQTVASQADVIYTMTFMGEAHDLNVGVAYLAQANTCFIQPIPEVQQITISSTGTYQGYFALQVGAGNVTPDINFNRSNPGANGMEGDIQGALQALGGTFANVSVKYISGTFPPSYIVVFGGAGAGIDFANILLTTSQRVPNPADPTDPGRFSGSAGAVELTKGRIPNMALPTPNTVQVGTRGSTQTFASIAMEPSGSFVSAWTQYSYDNLNLTAGLGQQGIYVRRFAETSDTAGVVATDLLQPTGQRINDGSQIDTRLRCVVVTFDEELMDDDPTQPGYVGNLSNWALLKNGVEYSGAIEKVEFGKSRSKDYSPVTNGVAFSDIGSDKWEAVVWFDITKVDATDGQPALDQGTYRLIAKNSLREKNGNPLGRTGFAPNGVSQFFNFTITVPSASETRVNNPYLVNANPVGIAGHQPVDGVAPQSPNQVASDGNGHFVAVYTTDTVSNIPGQMGVIAELYTIDNRRNTGDHVTTSLPIVVTQGHFDWEYAYPSVSMDKDGDFVVTWSARGTGTASDPPHQDWDIYARRFDATGTPIAGASGRTFRVNSEIKNAQKFSTVAVDAEGDFVITWQSRDQDGSGYGVYAQRFDSTGSLIGGVNEVQTIDIAVGRELTASDKVDLIWPDISNQAQNIPLSADITVMATRIQAAMEQLMANKFQLPADQLKDQVHVTVLTDTSLRVEFAGLNGNTDQPQISLNRQWPNWETDPFLTMRVGTSVDGQPGEVRVNDYTANDQTMPAVAMSNDGKYVITWTSQGQAGDAIYETNVYARLFASNDTISGSQAIVTGASSVVNTSPDGSYIVPTMNFADSNPAAHVQANVNFSGVGLVTVDDVFAGTGTLLLTGRHVLTAAHLFTDNLGNVTAQHVTVTFILPTGQRQVMEVANINVLPGWTGDASGGGHDLAVLELTQIAPATIQRSDIYRTTDEIGKTFTRVGYGAAGSGTTGTLVNDQAKRSGQNKYEAVAALAQFYPDALIYDFDDGTATHDFFGQKYGIVDLGTGATNESITNSGDSGGPTFINNQIAGVTSYAFSKPGTWNVQPTVSSTFGWGGADTRVSQYATWIDSVSSGSGTFLVNSTYTQNNQKWSSVAMDADGDFVITWTSYGEDAGGNGAGPGANGQEGVIARRFNKSGLPFSDEFVVNTFIDGSQEWSRVAMNAPGDFTVTWESFQDRPLQSTSLQDKPNSWGVYAQRFARNSQSTSAGLNGRVGGEIRVNATTLNDQRIPAVALNDNGDSMIVWSGYGNQTNQEDTQNGGVFMQTYDLPTLSSGPIVTDVLNATAGLIAPIPQVRQGTIITQKPSSFLVAFDEAIWTGRPAGQTPNADDVQSIFNLHNWQLTKDGQDVSSLLLSVLPSTDLPGKVAFRVNFASGGLDSGTYTLTLLDNVANYDPALQLPGNRLDGDGDGLAGGAFRRVFYVDAGGTPPSTAELQVNSTIAGTEDNPAMATNGRGDYFMVWTARGTNGDGAGDGNIMAQRFNSQGHKVGTEIIVNTTFLGNQDRPSVAMMPGYTIVTWSGAGVGDESGIFARAYDVFGKPLSDEVRINEFTDFTQRAPSVAVNAKGDVVITWTSVDPTGNHTGIYGRHFQFPSGAKPLLQTTDAHHEFAIGPTSTFQKDNSKVAVDSTGNYVVAYQFQDQGQYDWAIYVQTFNSSNVQLAAPARAHVSGTGTQLVPNVDINSANGDFVVTWTSLVNDANFTYDVFYRRYHLNGQALDATEKLANTTRIQWQLNSDVAISSDGTFNIVWQSANRDGNKLVLDYDIYRRAFDVNGVGGDEVRVNTVVAGDQIQPVIVTSDDPTTKKPGNPVVAWVGPDTDSTGIWASCASWRTGSSASTGTVTRATSAASPSNNWIPTGPGGAVGGGNLADRGMDIGVTTPGLLDPKSFTFYLRNTNSTGMATYTFGYGDPSLNWTPLIGDWDGDGNESIGFYDPKTSAWYLRNSNDSGYADIAFGFGAPNAGWIPLVGDWNGDGRDTPGFYDPKTSVWYLRNTNDTGAADVTFGYGAPGAGWKPLVGNWTGNGRDSIGFFDPKTSYVMLRYSNTVGMADNTFGFGQPGAGWTPVVGDWTGAGTDKLGFFDPTTAMFYLRNTLNTGAADIAFPYGAAGSGWVPVVGRWSPSQHLTAAGGTVVTTADVAALTEQQVQPLVQEALTRWTAAGASTEALAAMARAQVVVDDLPGSTLGLASPNRITLDSTAAGVGWFVDTTPARDEEFVQSGSHLQAVAESAVDRMDLLTVIEHELGHLAGLTDLDSALDSLMSGSLTAGTRHLPSAQVSDNLFASDTWR